ncbi:hypothetical protein PFICI_13906 [Pestalotiopsis fici W106-1]|uniref:Uncharacterized protein n=1 Tax=Pestalotiopsis fici (strain W106-1 / CGMCC3.15140) TaxID=1229662 RepID=W3WJC9_PESFW|nr:uncharacterized protein PFICI_13906 [Pestalotiopsis fici W106-1]ETS74040.1 hypothetical protein PFICI_13906 [Pestalotiopsis fici W106-1]
MALDDSSPRIAIWTQVVPTLAVDHAFLMHGVLAVSAAHLARTRPNQRDRYLPIAHEHHDRGLELFQELDRAGIPSANVHSLHEAKITFKLMQVVLSLALTEPTRDADQDLDSFTDWLVSLRFFFRTAHQLYDGLGGRESRITALLRRAEDGPPELSRLDEGLEKSLNLLDAKNRTSENNTSAIDKEHISDAIAKTKLWMRLVSLRPRTALFVATCAINLGADFFRLVKQRNPEALMVMAHFLVPMCRMPKRWFWDGRFDGIIATIVKMLPAEDWQVHLKWVLGQVDISNP